MDTINYLAPPSSKPSCDRYTQLPKIKPTPLCSPDDVLHAHISIMASEADFKIGQTIFYFPKRQAKPWKREVHLLENIFRKLAVT